MESDDREMSFASASPSAYYSPALVSLSPFSPSPRRLSSNFIPSIEPVPADRRLNWVFLRDRLVGGEEFSSVGSVEEGAAWELFSSLQRVIVVAVFAVAAVNSEKNKLISELHKSVELRDLVLSAMQEELNDLCEQVNNFKDQPDKICDMSSTMNAEHQFDDSFSGNINSVGCGCQQCIYHHISSNDVLSNAVVKASNCEDTFNFQLPLMNIMEPEERRMSSLSDWAPSVVSSIDIQLQLDSEQDIYNLRKECEEKDTTIKELSENLHSYEVITSKRIAELEDIIRKKKVTITKLKKDAAILEQKVSYLTRLRRPSFTKSSSNASMSQLSIMSDNLMYDMDSATSPSSSDSECSPRNKSEVPVAKSQKFLVQNSKCYLNGDHKPKHATSSHVVENSTEQHQSCRLTSPVKKKLLNQKPDVESFSRLDQRSVDEDIKIMRRVPTRSKDAILQKRWAS